jgi:hypothetical protein
VPEPAIEPAVIRPSRFGPRLPPKSTKPLPLVMNCALPPVLPPMNLTEPPLLVMMVALPAVERILNCVNPLLLLVMVADAAEA